MFVRKKKIAGKNMIAVQLVEGFRDPMTGKVRQKVIRHIGSSENQDEIAKLVELGSYIKYEIEGQEQRSLFQAEEIITSEENKPAQDENYAVDDFRKLKKESQQIKGIHEIYGKVYDSLGFNGIMSNPARKVHAVEVVKQLVMARIANPDSKRETVSILAHDFGINLKLDSLYNSMDKLDDKAIDKLQDLALQGAQGLLREKIDILFYDVTTLYFESFENDELREKGFSKDNKFNQTQVVLSLFVSKQGIPVGYELFPGSTYEGHTLVQSLNALKGRYAIENVVFVGDSGMLNEENLKALEENGYSYIVGARIKSSKKLVQQEILGREGYQSIASGEEEYQYKEIELEAGRRLVATYSAKRAYKDAKDRSEAINKLAKRIAKNSSVKAQLSNNGYRKYLKLEGAGRVSIDASKIEEAAVWDGLHGVITNNQELDAVSVINQYKGLWQIEETFRLTKHDLKIRPIYHYTAKRIRAHIAICFMALCCMRHLEYRVNLSLYKMSPRQIKKALTSVQVTYLRHSEDGRRFAVPDPINNEAKLIYKLFNKTLSDTPYLA